MAIALGLVVSFFVIEAGVRIFLAMYPNDIEALRQFKSKKQSGATLQMADFVRLSPNRRLVYELIPGSAGEFKGAPIRINSAGFFDPERSLTKADNVFRIAALGDSLLFGWGVPMQKRYSNLLEKFLNQTDMSGRSYEVLNFAVPGYNSVMEAELLRNRVLDYRPDAVLVAFCFDNDHQLPNFVARPLPLMTLSHSYAWDLLQAGSRGSALGALQAGLQQGDPNRVPPQYQYLVGWPRAFAALEEIRRLAASRGLKALFLQDYYWLEHWNGGKIAHDDDLAKLYEQVSRFGYVVVNPAPDVVDFLGQHQYHSIALWLSQRDVHPNEIRHAILGKALYRGLVEPGILPDSKSRRTLLAQDLQRWDEIIERSRQRLRDAGTLLTSWEGAPVPAEQRTHLELRRGGQTEYLGMGWCAPEDQGTWICGDPATLHFRLNGTVPLEVRLKAWALSSGNHGFQTVVARLNGRAEQRVALPPGEVREVAFSFPADATAEGLNRLMLSCAWAQRPSEQQTSPDQRLLFLDVSEVDFSVPVSAP